MLHIATDWSTISSLATGFGTLVLAVATFASVRSANRSARVAEQALQEQRRPVLTQSRLEDPVQKIMFVEGHWVRAGGSRGVAEHADGTVYLAMSLRNVGAGIGVCQGWFVSTGLPSGRDMTTHTPEENFRLQSRDLYIPAGDIGMWQGALRDHNDPAFRSVADAIDARETISIELLYSDQVGGQRTISRFGLTPMGEQDWFASTNRHWYLDGAGPRSDEQVAAAAEAVIRAREEAAAQAESAPEPMDRAQANGADVSPVHADRR